MARGGSRPGSGPPPSLNALARVRDGKEWVKLPQQGLPADEVPPWPDYMPDHEGLPDPPPLRVNAKVHQYEAREEALAVAIASRAEAMARNERERDYWRKLWTEQPQAHVWRADGVQDMVALFVRTTMEATAPGGTTAARTLVKQLASDLLLNVAALHSARYVIDRMMQGTPAMPDPARPVAATGTDGAAKRTRSVRDGLTIVPSAADDDDPGS